LRGQQPMKTRLGRSVRFVEALVTSVILSVTVLGQTAKQGDASQIPRCFHSPMVLETVFAAADRTLWTKKDRHESGRDWFTVPEYHALGRFTCDGVSLRDPTKNGEWRPGLFLSARDLPDGNVDVGIFVKVRNPGANSDKLVKLSFEVLNGDEVVASATMEPINVEDNARGDDGEVRLTVPAAALRIEPMTKLRITMTTRDD
jgi:hypothetical protein